MTPNVPAHDDALMFVLANQQRRPSMLRAVAGRVNESSFACFVELVDDPDFDSKLQHAIDHPNTKDAKQFMRKVLPLLSFIGQEKPWGKSRRASFSCAPALVSERGIARLEQSVHDISRQTFSDSEAQARRRFPHRLRASVGAGSSQRRNGLQPLG